MADDLTGGSDRRRACALVDQRDLAEVVALRQRRDLLAVDRDGRFPGLDHEERSSTGALLRDRLARGELTVFEEPRDVLDVALAQVGEQRDPLENTDRTVGGRALGRGDDPARVIALHCSR